MSLVIFKCVCVCVCVMCFVSTIFLGLYLFNEVTVHLIYDPISVTIRSCNFVLRKGVS